jgi:N-acylglucosamine-6-phosphate 2-epimerase
VEAGAAAVALDCTRRGQRYAALERIPRMKKKLGVPILADIATEEEAKAAAAAGADYVLSTMRGYTSDTAQIRCFEPEFIARLVSVLNIPVIAEGQIHSPEEARAALLAGAYAVIDEALCPHDASGSVEATCDCDRSGWDEY